MKKNGNRLLPLIIFVSLCAIFVIFFVYMSFADENTVADEITMEAGADFPDESAFILKSGVTGDFAADLTLINLRVPGAYPVEIKIGNKTYSSILNIVDTVPPAAAPVDWTVIKGTPLFPEDFVKDVEDATDVYISFETVPDVNRLGTQTVTLTLTDGGNNVTKLSASLEIIEGFVEITAEAGSNPEDLDVSDFISSVSNVAAHFETDVSTLDFNVLGRHEIQININGSVSAVFVALSDTTPPTATVADRKVWLGDGILAADFVTDIIDATEVLASLAETLDTSVPGEYEVCIILTDEGGNRTEYTAILTVEIDEEPPVFYGIENIYILPGESVMYRKNVSAADESDGEVDFRVDSSEVDIFTEGRYPVIYTAVDSSGNEASFTAYVTVTSLSPELVYEMADEILAKILKDNMSDREKAQAVYTWVRNNVRYTSKGEKDDVIKGAYNAFKLRSGDCYTYYAASEVLLTRAGIDNIGLERVGGKTMHFWNIINVGDGWYHFDTCPHKEWFNGFMFTESQAQKYTRERGNNYYTYDAELYPEVVWE